jgi:hypothetical protein
VRGVEVAISHFLLNEPEIELDFFERAYIANAARELIKERAIQPTLHNPLHIREVKPVLSRSYSPLLWICILKKGLVARDSRFM